MIDLVDIDENPYGKRMRSTSSRWAGGSGGCRIKGDVVLWETPITNVRRPRSVRDSPVGADTLSFQHK